MVMKSKNGEGENKNKNKRKTVRKKASGKVQKDSKRQDSILRHITPRIETRTVTLCESDRDEKGDSGSARMRMRDSTEREKEKS